MHELTNELRTKQAVKNRKMSGKDVYFSSNKKGK